MNTIHIPIEADRLIEVMKARIIFLREKAEAQEKAAEEAREHDRSALKATIQRVNQAAERHEAAVRRWKALPFWRRWRTARPQLDLLRNMPMDRVAVSTFLIRSGFDPREELEHLERALSTIVPGGTCYISTEEAVRLGIIAKEV